MQNIDRDKEKELLIKIRQGEINQFTYFVKTYTGVAQNYTRLKINNRQDVEDVVQNAFIKIYKNLDKFDLKQTFYPLFFTILKNEIVDYYRKKQQTVSLNENWVQSLPYPVNIPEYRYIDVLRSVKKEYQTVLQLYAEGYSYQEIAVRLNKSINTIKTLIRRGRMEAKKYAQK